MNNFKLFTIASLIWIKTATVTVTISAWACCLGTKTCWIVFLPSGAKYDPHLSCGGAWPLSQMLPACLPNFDTGHKITKYMSPAFGYHRAESSSRLTTPPMACKGVDYNTVIWVSLRTYRQSSMVSSRLFPRSTSS